MAGSTISNLINISVTLGSAAYPSTLTITPTGTIDARAGGPAGASGLVATISYGYALNLGTVSGGAGRSGYSGGSGVDAANSSLTNTGVITGGAGSPAGGYHPNRFGAGPGGSGVVITRGSLTNSGTITGGDGGYGGNYGGGYGGAGAYLRVGSSLTNTGAIIGGSGGAWAFGPPFGAGAGVALVTGSSLSNDGTIAGGSGYSAVAPYGYNGSGGTGADVTGGSLTNNGTIAGGNAGNSFGRSGNSFGRGGNGGAGVYLRAGSSLTNLGAITGGNSGQLSTPGSTSYGDGGSGVRATNSSLTNDGTITGASGASGDGIDAASSEVTNNGTIVSGHLRGDSGSVFAEVNLSSSTLTNNGTIVGADVGVALSSGGLVTNAASAEIVGYRGLVVSGAGTVINAGTIAAYSNVPGHPAVSFSGTGAHLLVVDPGAVFVGNIYDNGSPGTLELASAAGAGTIVGIGTSFTGFGTITIDAGSTWAVTGSVTGSGTIDLGAQSDLILRNGVDTTSPVRFTAATGTLGLGDPADFASTVYGLRPGDAIDFTTITSTGSITAGVDGSNELTLTSGGTLLTEIKLNPAQSFAGDAFQAAPDSSGGTLITETAAGSTISNLVTISVTLGSAAYRSPLTITPTGTIDPTAGGLAGATGLVATISYGYAVNLGIVSGGAGKSGGSGGSGVDVASSSLTNSGTITGGAGSPAGGYHPNRFGGGPGGSGVVITSGRLTNSGTITGGDGGYGGNYGGGYGGVGAYLRVGSSLTNTGAIIGGSGAAWAFGPPFGAGAGVALVTGSSLSNDGTIAGGSGYTAIAPYGYNGSGGTGADVTGGSLTNNGTIAGGNAGSRFGRGGNGGAGVYLRAGSSLTNLGAITGGNPGQLNTPGSTVYGDGGSGVRATNSSLTNDGTITGASGASGDGIDATSSEVTNNGTIVSGHLRGDSGSVFAGVNLSSSTLTNNGTIVGADAGVALSSGALVTNAASAEIVGYRGVVVSGGGTVINAGTIAASNNGEGHAAITFSGIGADLLVVDPGAVFVGNIYDNGSPGTLELAYAAGAGTIVGIGTSFVGFGTITVDAGATWAVTGSVTGSGTIDLGAQSDLTLRNGVDTTSPVHFTARTGTLRLGDPADFASTVYGLRPGYGGQPGDAIDFTTITSAGSIIAGVNGSNELTLTSGGTLLTEIKLDPTQDFAFEVFHAAPDGSGGTVVTVVTETPLCFLQGTLIATPSGEVPIEQLALGDLVLTVLGNARPIAWIGTGRVLATRGRRNAATPVIVRKGALADNVPHRDLRVTKAHSLYLDGVLIPVEFLVNHRSILWDDQAQEVSLYHVELATHDVLIANGAPAESYRDDGNRWLFRNANSGWDLPPQVPYAAVRTGGPVVDAAWRRLLQRAGAHSSLRLTDDPDLHLLVDGQRLDAASRHGEWHVFQLASRPGNVRIASRAGAPQELGLARDPRTLGVGLRSIMARQGVDVRTIAAKDARLTDGFHDFEPDNDIRWTDGDAALPADLFDDFGMPCEIVLRLGGTTSYVDEGSAVRRAA